MARISSDVVNCRHTTHAKSWQPTCPIQYEHAPLRVRCAMLRKHPPVDLVLSCLSCL